MVAMKIGVLFLFAVAGGLAILWIRRGSAGSPGRRPERRSRLVRILCALSGGGILVAFLWGTIDGARAVLTVKAPQKLQIPTLPPPKFSKEQGSVAQGRFLLQVVLVRRGQLEGLPLGSDTFDLRWPQDRDRHVTLRADLGPATFTMTESIDDIQYLTGGHWLIEGRCSRELESSHRSSSRTGGSQYCPGVEDFGDLGGETRLFALGRTPREDLEILTLLTPVQEEDPLREGSVEDLIPLLGSSHWRAGRDSRSPTAYPPLRPAPESPAEALARSLDFNLFPLLAAALLLAQLYRRRSLGFVKVVACIILYLGALDRVSLRIIEGSAREASLPQEIRVDACRRMASSLFFQRTGVAHLKQISHENSFPSPIRAAAASLAREDFPEEAEEN